MNGWETKWPAGPWHRNIRPATKYPSVWSGRNKHVAALARGLTDDEAEAVIDLLAASPCLFAAGLRMLPTPEMMARHADAPDTEKIDLLTSWGAVRQLAKALARARGETP